jgi:hypothetical protein
MTAAAEFEVPRSIPMTRPISILLCTLLSRTATVSRGISGRAALPLFVPPGETHQLFPIMFGARDIQLAKM